jgi:hypothetical protein
MIPNSLIKGTINCEMKQLPLKIKIKGETKKISLFLSFNADVSAEWHDLSFTDKN